MIQTHTNTVLYRREKKKSPNKCPFCIHFTPDEAYIFYCLRYIDFHQEYLKHVTPCKEQQYLVLYGFVIMQKKTRRLAWCIHKWFKIRRATTELVWSMIATPCPCMMMLLYMSNIYGIMMSVLESGQSVYIHIVYMYEG